MKEFIKLYANKSNEDKRILESLIEARTYANVNHLAEQYKEVLLILKTKKYGGIELTEIIDNLDFFHKFKANNAEELGREELYLEDGYDESNLVLQEYFDFKKYGEYLIGEYDGEFIDGYYVYLEME